MESSSRLSQIGFVSVYDGYRSVTKIPGVCPPSHLLDQSFAVADAAHGITTAPSTTFEPVLNLPAFGAFFFIAIVFGFLQYRIAAIGKAAEKRTEALAYLRELKSLEIAGKEIPSGDIEKAKEEYKNALEDVERLRTVIPGFARIAPPPSESENRERMEENVAAAKQFLDMDLSSTLPPKEDFVEKRKLSPFLLGTLVVVGVSQVALLLLFVMGPQPTDF